MEMRDKELEMKLQSALSQGSNVWVVGDVHGYFSTLKALIERISLGENDHVVMLGDLIDRGPESANIVEYVRSSRNLHSIRGNHEQMMIEGFDNVEFFKNLSMEAMIWYHNGGKTTESSYIAMYENNKEIMRRASEDLEWMLALPTEIVLHDWRLVHGGYDQNRDVEDESQEDIHMYARKQFFSSGHAIDPERTILFGHSVTFKHLYKDESKAGLIWESEVKLDDGRSMAIGLDTCLYHDLELPKVLSAFNLQTNEVIYQTRI